jgi:hypothetical protein
MLKARDRAAPPDADGLGGEIGSTVPLADASGGGPGSDEVSTEG